MYNILTFLGLLVPVLCGKMFGECFYKHTPKTAAVAAAAAIQFFTKALERKTAWKYFHFSIPLSSSPSSSSTSSFVRNCNAKIATVSRSPPCVLLNVGYSYANECVYATISALVAAAAEATSANEWVSVVCILKSAKCIASLSCRRSGGRKSSIIG